MAKEKSRASGEFGEPFGAELAPEDYAAYAAYGQAPQYKNVARVGERFNYDKYVPQDPTYSRYYADNSQYANRGMPVYAESLGGPYYHPEVVRDEQGYPQPTGYARRMGIPATRLSDRAARVPFDYQSQGYTDEYHDRRKREEWLYNMMRERMKYD